MAAKFSTTGQTPQINTNGLLFLRRNPFSLRNKSLHLDSPAVRQSNARCVHLDGTTGMRHRFLTNWRFFTFIATIHDCDDNGDGEAEREAGSLIQHQLQMPRSRTMPQPARNCELFSDCLGIHLRRLISLKPDEDSKRHTLLVADWNHEIGAELRIGAAVVLLMSDSPFRGKDCAFHSV